MKTPSAGDVISFYFKPGSGHEQAYRRPAIVLSPSSFNQYSMLYCIPTTTSVRSVWAVKLASLKEKCFALTNQMISIDWRSRSTKIIGKVSVSEFLEIKNNILDLIIPTAYGD